MNPSFKNYSNIFIIISCLLGIWLIRSCESIAEKEALIKSYDQNYTALKKKSLRDSSVIYSQSVEVASTKAQVKSLEGELEAMKIKDPEVVVKTQVKTVFKTKIELVADSTPSGPVLRLPKDIFKTEKWFTLGGTINRLGVLQIDSIVSHGTLTYAIGDTLRAGLVNKIFGNKDKVVSLHMDNPHMEITGMKAIVVSQEKKWYQTTAFKVGAGVLLGATLVSLGK
jgi:hypothetical protein